MFEQFESAKVGKRQNSNTVLMIDRANAIIEEYEAKGYYLTLRQLYYQFVSRKFIKNKHSEYKRLGLAMNIGRLAGLVDWNSISDSTRFLRDYGYFADVPAFIKNVESGYAEDVWSDQNAYVEVWIEKDALVGVIERSCHKWRVPYFSCRGNNSQSEMYIAGNRLAAKQYEGKEVTILHLGDHDPNGIDMSRDNHERLCMFMRNEDWTFNRIALNMDQIATYNPPPDPVKVTDTRAAGYIRNFGRDCWELDALDPDVISNLVGSQIEKLVDKKLFDVRIEQEAYSRSRIARVSDRWNEVDTFLDTPYKEAETYDYAW